MPAMPQWRSVGLHVLQLPKLSICRRRSCCKALAGFRRPTPTVGHVIYMCVCEHREAREDAKDKRPAALGMLPWSTPALHPALAAEGARILNQTHIRWLGFQGQAGVDASLHSSLARQAPHPLCSQKVMHNAAWRGSTERRILALRGWLG